ncbi:MAG: integrase arm-type DNA-binding domain-containing protein [Desulfovibrio sp.]|nr:integrase arm-type DNA-binding domain-containing protein [Desulfovibrio sp.]
MGKLTDAKLRNLKADGTVQKHSDGDGLYAYIGRRSLGVAWWQAYRFNGKPKTLTLGKYPEIGLAEARKKSFEARQLLERGIDPGEQKKTERSAALAAERAAAMTVSVVGNQWFEKHSAEIVPITQKKLRWYLDTIFKYIGEIPFIHLERKTLVDAVKDIQDKTSPHMAHRIAGVLNRVCLYAWDCGYTDRNLADRISNALKPQKAKHRAALITPAEVGMLLQKIYQYRGAGLSVSYCLKILPYLALRSEEIRGARWEEIDPDTAVWTIPAMRHEYGGGMKMRIAHTIPLSRQVVSLFKELKEFQRIVIGDCDLCFPSPRFNGRRITSESLMVALKVIHGSSDISVHGFRTTFSTLARERGFNAAHVEKQLAHRERDSVIEAYDRSTYFEQRRGDMQEWADYLDELRDGSALTSILGNGIEPSPCRWIGRSSLFGKEASTLMKKK